MPPRFISCLIVMAWVGTTVWWSVRELGVSSWFGEPPPYTIDLGEEIRGTAGAIDWNIWRDEAALGSPAPTDLKSKVGSVLTETNYDSRFGRYDLHSVLKFTAPVGRLATNTATVESSYRITPDGDLRSIRSEVQAELSVLTATVRLKAKVEGPVENHVFRSTLKIEHPLSESIDLEPVEVSGHGGVLNPMHPVNRLFGLRPGQQWRVPVINPLSDAITETIRRRYGSLNLVAPSDRFFSATVGQGTLRFRTAESPGLASELVTTTEIPCLLIQYHSEDNRACTWVRSADAAVLQQEVFSISQNTRLVLQRKELPDLMQ